MTATYPINRRAFVKVGTPTWITKDGTDNNADGIVRFNFGEAPSDMWWIVSKMWARSTSAIRTDLRVYIVPHGETVADPYLRDGSRRGNEVFSGGCCELYVPPNSRIVFEWRTGTAGFSATGGVEYTLAQVQQTVVPAVVAEQPPVVGIFV